MRRGFLWVVIVVAAVALPAAALAQSENKAAADAAFKRGKKLIDEGKVEEACTEFKRSQELDPQFGTQYNLALCYEELGRLASAYGEYVELSARDTNKRRKADSKKRAAALTPRLTRLTLIAPDRPDGMTVTRDGQDITVLLDASTPIDPGVYVFRAEAEGFLPWEQKVDLTKEGEVVSVEIPALEPEPVTQPDPDPDPVPDPVPDPILDPVPDPAPAPGKGRKLLGMGLTGGGVVLTGVGLFFGFQAMGLAGDAEDACQGSLDPCTGDVVEARDLIEDARGKAMLSNVLVGAGLVAATAGVILWVTAPDSGERRTAIVPVVGDESVGLVLDGRF